MADNEKTTETITVKGVKKDLVGFWEIDPAHPDGEAFVKYDEPSEIAETAGALEAIAQGRIVKTDKKAAAEPAKAPAEAPKTNK